MTAPAPSLWDRLLDFAVVPGYTSIGYRLRSRDWTGPGDLSGRSILVTGASSGLGAETCAILAGAGASVHMLVRDTEKGEDVRARIAGRTASDELRVWRCDVSDLEDVRSFAERFRADVPALDALVNNAGVMPPERAKTDQGLELTFATNVAGPFLLTDLLLPALEAAAPSRVVSVSSGGMYTAKLQADDLQLEGRDYSPTAFYAHTKRCEVILAELWQEHRGDSGVTFHSVHPGWADTPGVTDSLPEFSKIMGRLLRSAHQGADTIAWLAWAEDPLRAPGAFWHDRRPRPTHRVPWTRESRAERERLWAECERVAGASPGPPEQG